MAETFLDVKGLRCPMPVLRARRRLQDMAPGEILVIEATDPQAEKDFPGFCEATGHRLLETRRLADHVVFKIACRSKEPGI
jgi:tRNA 2-thiouridine synthesizing protein A